LNKTPDTKAVTIKAPPDVRGQLERWASENCSSMTAEFVRAVRERAQREQAKADASA
jgi:predicted transcriptional regulator